jgi:putative ABC transport system substrate-binding protein
MPSTPKVRRIGVLDPGVPDSPDWLWNEAAPLRELGWVEGKNLRVERRYDEGRPETQQALAEELVRSKVELIVTGNSSTAFAAKRATDTIPIVIYGAADSVMISLVVSLARPVANVTGVDLASAELLAKALSLLKEVVPRLHRIGFLMNQENQAVFDRTNRAQMEGVCRSLGLTAVMVDLDPVANIGGFFQQLVERQAQTLVLTGAIWPRRFEIVDAAMKHGLPTIATDPDLVRDAGALMVYSWTWSELFRLRAKFIDRILRGAKPADLPVEQPTLFEFVINLKTARALGLTIPKPLLLQAKQVIQ